VITRVFRTGKNRRLEKVTYRRASKFVLFTKYENDKIKEEEIGGACSKQERDDKSIEFFLENYGSRTLRGPVDLKGTEWEGVDWINLLRDRGLWRTLV
jgi:hypothetical protein